MCHNRQIVSHAARLKLLGASASDSGLIHSSVTVPSAFPSVPKLLLSFNSPPHAVLIQVPPSLSQSQSPIQMLVTAYLNHCTSY